MTNLDVLTGPRTCPVNSCTIENHCNSAIHSGVMDKKKLLKDIAASMGKATLWTAEKTARATCAAVEYAYDHRVDIAKGAGLAASAAVSSVKGAALFAYDTAALKIFSKEKLDRIGGCDAAKTQTWWLGLLVGIGSRYLAGRGRRRREVYQELVVVTKVNERVLEHYRKAIVSYNFSLYIF